jgi:hypothetical protein
LTVAVASGGTTGGTEPCSIVGTWTLTYNWGAPSTSSITFAANGTFSSSSGSTGTWALSGNAISWTYTSGTRYVGTVNSSCTSMSGTMIAFDGSTGTWSATR